MQLYLSLHTMWLC